MLTLSMRCPALLFGVTANREFLLFGGVVDDGTQRFTTGTVAALALDDLDDGLAEMTSIGTADYASAEVRIDAAGPYDGASYCEGVDYAICWNISGEGECTELWSAPIDKCDNTYVAAGDCDAVSGYLYEGTEYGAAYSACADDPYCEYGAIQNSVGVAGLGVAGAGVVYDPVSDALRVLGGYSGCVEGTCSDWASAYIHHHPPSLAAAPGRGRQRRRLLVGAARHLDGRRVWRHAG